MTIREVRSFCRICPGFCGVRVSIDAGHIVAVHGDKDHAITSGYICSKGSLAVDMHEGANRLLHPLKRQPDGSFMQVTYEAALDEIALRMRSILDREGPDAVAFFRGTANGLNATATPFVKALIAAIGTTSDYSTMTIDQSAKWVTNGRLGEWGAGRQHMDQSDVLMMFGSNPLVSLLGGLNNFAPLNPVRRIKEAKARGMKLIIIDPRYTETARYADVFLQPYPGEDPTIAAGMLRMILCEGWEDREFTARYAPGISVLREAVAPFTPDYVGRRAGIAEAALRDAVTLFARDSRTGAAASGTGPNMAPRSNLADHLIESLNVVCGRFARAGDPIANPGALSPPTPQRAEVLPPRRSWERGVRSRIRGIGTLYGERMSGLLADEILTAGPGRISALFSAGANPAMALPDQRHAVRALKSLDLLVAIEPFMTATARLAHYILPTRLLYERADLPPTGFYERALYPRPFAQYTAALVEPPNGSDVVDDWYVYWALARRLGKTLIVNSHAIDMVTPPSTDALLSLLLDQARVPLDEMRKHPSGMLCQGVAETVLPADQHSEATFDVMPADVAEELAAVASELASQAERGCSSFRLTSRRLRDVVNTTGHQLPRVRHYRSHNPAYMNSADMQRLGLREGDGVEIESETGRIQAIVQEDDTVRCGVVSISHGWGGLPDDKSDLSPGACTNLLVRTDCNVEKINAMPVMSALRVSVRRVQRVVA